MAVKITKLDLLDNRSELVQEVLGRKPNWVIRWGISLIFAIILLLLCLTYFIQYPDIITAKVFLTSSDPPSKLIARSSGHIELLVVDGETVEKNQLIAIINNTSSSSQVLSLIDTLDAFKINMFEVTEDRIKSLAKFNRLGDLQLPFNYFLQSIRSQYLYYANQPVRKEILAIEEQIEHHKIAIHLKKEQLENYVREVDIARLDYERNQQLYKEKAISLISLEEKEVSFLEAKNILTNAQSVIQSHHLAISELRNKLVVLQNHDIEQNAKLISDIEVCFKNLTAAMSSWQQKYLLRSPLYGKVALLDFWSDGQYLDEGDYIASIIPASSDNEILVRAKSPMSNSGKLKIGMDVRINLDGFPFAEYGSLTGQVKSISLVPKEDYYIIEISLTSKELKTTVGKEIEFKQEMQGTAEMISEDIRLIERFFYEIRKIFKN